MSLLAPSILVDEIQESSSVAVSMLAPSIVNQISGDLPGTSGEISFR